MTILHPQQAYSPSLGLAKIQAFIFRDRDPTSEDPGDVLYSGWVNTVTKAIWYLEAISSSNGSLFYQWRAVGPIIVTSVDPTPSDYQYPIGQTWVNRSIAGTITAATQANPCVITSEEHGLTTGATIVIAGVVGMTELNGNVYTVTVLTADTFSINTDSTLFNAYISGGAWISEGNNYWVLTNVVNNLGFWSRLAAGSGVEKFFVDDFTGPGTNPVVPNALTKGITITGGQVAAGMIANSIRTNSLAANTYTVEVQQSSAQVAETESANGVCHFKDADFTVTNGFVELKGLAGFDWNVINQGTQPANFAVNNGYICQAGGTGNVSIALPAVSALGDTIEIVLDGATTWTITQGAGQSIRFSNSVTTVGVGGSIATTGTGDAIKLVCETSNLRWIAVSAIGNLTVL
jgi:Ubiquitin-activating enzyme E1 FCCH domain